MKNGWLGFSKHSYSSKHFYISLLGELGELVISTKFTKPIIFTKSSRLKIAYDKIIFVRNKGAEAEHSTPM
jgi:hypothetical protein